jgi:hypothetical protein
MFGGGAGQDLKKQRLELLMAEGAEFFLWQQRRLAVEQAPAGHRQDVAGIAVLSVHPPAVVADGLISGFGDDAPQLADGCEFFTGERVRAGDRYTLP